MISSIHSRDFLLSSIAVQSANCFHSDAKKAVEFQIAMSANIVFVLTKSVDVVADVPLIAKDYLTVSGMKMMHMIRYNYRQMEK